MTSGIVSPEVRPSEPPPQRKPPEHEGYVDRRLRQTRRQVKRVDLWAGLIALGAGTLAYLLVVTLADHWLIPSGLGFWGRLIMFGGLLAGVGVYLAVWIVPILIHRINPIFAAHSIEQSRPSLKNSLVNLLYLRRQRSEIDRDELARGIYQALEWKAAADLAEIPADTAVDRSHVIRLGYLLAAILAVCCLYLVLSPKSTLVSFRRVLWPWADIKAPTRVTIEDVEPGDQVVYQGDIVGVSATVGGLADDEAVMLYYTTADGRSVDQAIPLTISDGGYRHRCDLPPGRFGLQQDCEYYLAAGDCRTRRFRLDVETALSILVDRVEYDYPEYTGIPDRVDQRVADLKAIEGTRVTIRAASNHEIRRASVEMDCDSRHALKMTVDGPKTATARFTLSTDRSDPARPEHESYQLRFTDTTGQQNRRPIRHRIEVIADLPPEIRFVDPPPEETELAEDGMLELRVRAEDPDFALRRVVLRAERGERSLPISPLLDKPRPQPPHEGPFQKAYRFEPARLGLKAGEKVIYWAEAEDNMYWGEGQANTPSSNAAKTARRPPNRAETVRRWITIVPPEGRRQPDEPPAQPEETPSQQPPEEQAEPPDQPEAGQQDQEGDTGQSEGQDRPAEQQPGPTEQQPGPTEGQPGQPDQSQPSSEGPGEEGTGQQTSDQQQDGQKAETSASDSEPGGGSQESPSAEAGPGGKPETGAESGADSPTPREPIDGQTNPGDAFEEILKHRAEQEQKQGASDQSAKPHGQEGQPQPGAEQPDQQPGDQAKSQGDQQQPPQGGTESPATDQGDAQAVPDNAPDGSQGTASKQPPEKGQGAQAKGAGEPTEEEAPGEGHDRPDARGGDPQETEGQGGAGKPSSEDAASPSPQGANEQRDKQLGEGDQSEPSQGESGQSPSTSPKDSDSQGDTSGDRSGGGERGGGQKSEQSGTGTAGTHTASEQGGSQSDQQGEGPTGPHAGDQVKADRPTGRPAEEGEGPGSGQQKQPGGGRPRQESQDQQGAPPSGQQSDSDKPADGQTPGYAPGREGTPSGSVPASGGRTGQEPLGSTPPEPGTHQPEDPNLQYARKATELALEYLEEQLAEDDPDPKLLDRLGWSKEDLKRFYQQWDRMRREADGRTPGGEAAREEFQKALDSLGLRPRGTELRGGQTQVDRVGNLKEGLRFTPPPEWAEAYRAFKIGVAGGEE